MADFYLKSGSATERANSTAYTVGQKVVIARADTSTNYATVRKWVLECTTAGTTGAAPPAWPASVTQDVTTVTDGTVVWTFRKPGYSSGTTANWAYSAIYMDYVATAMAAGDRLFVSATHSESVAGGYDVIFPGTIASPNQILCVSDASAPPTALATGAVVAGTAGASMRLGGTIYVHGLRVKSGSGASGATIFLCSTIASAQEQYYSDCVFELSTTDDSTSSVIAFAYGSLGSRVILRYCKVKFGNAAQKLWAPLGVLEWYGGGIEAGSQAITTLFYNNNQNRNSAALLSGLDLSAADAGLVIASSAAVLTSKITLRNCKMPALWAGGPGLLNNTPGNRVELYNCDSADTNYRMMIADAAGSITTETTIVRSGGASDGATPISWKMVTDADAEYPLVVLRTPEIYRWNTTIGTAITVSAEIVHDSQGSGTGGGFTDKEAWIEVEYLGTSGVPLGVYKSDVAANPLDAGTTQDSSTATWTTTGLTTPVKQKLSVSITPQEVGHIIARVCLAATSKTCYVCPKIEVA